MRSSLCAGLLFLTACAGGPSFPETTVERGPDLFPPRVEGTVRERYRAAFGRGEEDMTCTLVVLMNYPEDPFRIVGLSDLGSTIFDGSFRMGEPVTITESTFIDAAFLEDYLVEDLMAVFTTPETFDRVRLMSGEPGRMATLANHDWLVVCQPGGRRVWLGSGTIRARATTSGTVLPREVFLEGLHGEYTLNLRPLDSE